MLRRTLITTSAVLVGLWGATAAASPADLLSHDDLKALGAQRYWYAGLPLPADELVTRVALLDDNLYVLTNANRVFAVHARTGILRWSRRIAEEGQTIRGPSHTPSFVFFTTSGAVRVLNRRTGEPAGEPRNLRGVIIEVIHDTATINIGQLHGVSSGDILHVYGVNQDGAVTGDPFAQLRITSIQPRSAKGRLIRLSTSRRAGPGDPVQANVVLPLKAVELPFAATSAAIADETRIYVGAANQRLYALDMRQGYRLWQLLTPRTVSATPVLRKNDLYIAGQNGMVVSCTKEERTKNWTFQTEGPVFADLFVDDQRVLVASSDRSLYCLDRQSGRRLWRKRFDTPLRDSPVLAHGRVYQRAPQQGLVVLDVASGKELWRREAGGRFLVQFGEDAYLFTNAGADGATQLLRTEADTGRVRAAVDTKLAQFAAASQEDQSIILATRLGDLVCLRSKHAPHLRPVQLAEVLLKDRTQAARPAGKTQGQTPRAKASPIREKEKVPPHRSLFEDDLLSSRSTAKPVGGHGLVEVRPTRAAGTEEEAAEDEEDEDEEGEDEDEEWDEEDEDSGEEDMADESDDDDEYDDDDDAEEDEEEDL